MWEQYFADIKCSNSSYLKAVLTFLRVIFYALWANSLASVALQRFHYLLLCMLSGCSGTRRCRKGISRNGCSGKNAEGVTLPGRFSRVWGQHHNRVLRVRLSGEGYDKLIGMDDKGGTHWVFKGVFLTSQHVSLNGVALLGFNLEHKICYLILIGICRLCLDVNPASLAWLNCDNVVVHISVGEPALAQETVRRRNMKRKLAKTANFPPAGETLSVSPRSFVSVCMKAGDFFVLIVV